MKIHEGKCTPVPCNKTHAYKCRACGILYRNDPYRGPREKDYPSPYYPYCSDSCAAASKVADKGYHLFAPLVDYALSDSAAKAAYPDPSAHQDFNMLMQEVKSL